MTPAQLGLVAQATPPTADGAVGARPTGNRLPLAAALLFAGVGCFVGGAALAWGSNPLLGFTVGGFGAILLVIGSILARIALVGRYLEGDGE